MEIPVEYRGYFAYHFTHVNNLDSIIKHGLLGTNMKQTNGISHTNIASTSIQARRSEMQVTCGPKGTIHDYVPFYFCTVNPMLLSVLNTRNVDQQHILFLCVCIDILLQEGTVFTDASANTKKPPNFYYDPKDLDKLDWAAITSRKWKVSSDDERHRRMAELLIYKQLNIEEITDIIVWNDSMKDIVKSIFKQNGVPAPLIGIEPFHGKYFYYTKFQTGEPTQSLITGPYFFKLAFEEIVEQIKDKRQTVRQHSTFPFKDVTEAIEAIEEDFSSISEMADIFDLQINCSGRIENVSNHTLAVVRQLKGNSFYQSCDVTDQNILLLSAYLHDIGKAPAQSVKGQIHYVYADYPVYSMEKLSRLLTEEIEEISDYEIRKICLLVGYHDLVADIALNHRDKEQLFDLIEDETELDMLIAISSADISEIDLFMEIKVRGVAKTLRQEAIDQLSK